MLRKLFLILLCFMGYPSVTLSAGFEPPCVVLWENQGSMPDIDIVMNQGSSYDTTVTIIGNENSNNEGFWFSSGISLFSERLGNSNVSGILPPSTKNLKGQTKWAVLKLPKVLTYDQLGGNVVIKTNISPIPSGFTLREMGNDWVLVGKTPGLLADECVLTGHSHDSVRFWMPDVNLNLSLDANTHVPGGVYDLPFTYTYGYLENKYVDFGVIGPNEAINYVQANSSPQQTNIHLTVNNQCEFDVTEIHLDHGDLPANSSAHGHQSDTQNLNINCVGDTLLNFEVKRVDNTHLDMPKNFIDCGQQGYCRVSFIYNDITYNQSTILMQKGTIGVFSKFFFKEPSEGAPITGPFVGNAVLSVDIE